MEIFVSELPKNCKECSLHRSGCLKIKKGARYIDAETCVLGNFYKFQEIDNEIDTCPLKPLSDRLAEERKKVCNQVKVDIRSLFNSYASSLIDYCIWNKNADANQKLYNNFKRIINDRLVKVLDLFDKRIDQIERGTDD